MVMYDQGNPRGNTGSPYGYAGGTSGDYGPLAPAPPDDYQYETPEDVYRFARLRINQDIDALQNLGASPVEKKADYFSSLGGRLKGWDSYNAAKGLAQARYEQQLALLNKRLEYLDERYEYQFPVTDLV